MTHLMLYLGAVDRMVAGQSKSPAEQIRRGIRNTPSHVPYWKRSGREDHEGGLQKRVTRAGTDEERRPSSWDCSGKAEGGQFPDSCDQAPCPPAPGSFSQSAVRMFCQTITPRCNKSSVITLQERGDGSELWEKSASHRIHSQEFISQTFESLHVRGSLWMAPAGWHTTRQKFMNDFRSLLFLACFLKNYFWKTLMHDLYLKSF